MSRSLVLLSLSLAVVGACRTEPKPGTEGSTGGLEGTETDEDGDGYGEDDCNDGDASVHPGAVERCDGIDNNCDGQVDEGATAVFYEDSDADGFGDDARATEACAAPEGFVASAGDCDDANPAVFPSAAEACDGLDNDCDGSIDEDVGTVVFADVDGDGHGDPATEDRACTVEDGFVELGDDCDDADPESFPGNPEVCDEADNNCDGAVDEGVGTTFYVDADADGWGLVDQTTEACAVPEGYAAVPGDCVDTDPAVHPAATEVCNGQDDDCDALVDDADDVWDTSTGGVFYTDADADGYGDPANSTEACSAPSGTVTNSGDCNDAEPLAWTGNTESCDSVDNDCNGAVDEGVTTTYYTDADADGYGDPASSTEACSAPSGTVTNTGDCNDAEPLAWTGNTESCDSVDNDCNGAVDEGVTTTYYTDADADGYGDPASSTEACSAPSGTVTNSGDCNDAEPLAWTGNTESCDSVDNDCNGAVDEGVTTTYYTDADADGYGDPASSTEACSAPSGTVSDSTDCDDTDASVYPSAPLACDGTDADCDGSIDNDSDGDGFSADTCGGDDCDDTDATVLPEADGTCALGADCRSLLAKGWTSSGTYTIDPDGHGTGEGPFDVSCDMSTDGGGWTLFLHLHDMSGLDEDDFIALFGHNRFTDELWSFDSATGAIDDALPASGLVLTSGQGALGADLMDGLWDDLRMSCSRTDSDPTESAYAQVDGYATTSGSWDLLGAVANGTSYAVDSTLQSTGQSTIWHDNETTSHNSNHYLCDIYNTTYTSAGGAPQFGFCYTDFLNNPNSSDYGDSIVTIAFGTVEGADGWSTGFTGECGNMGGSALQNAGTFSIWLR
jgi:hypothetical protein